MPIPVGPITAPVPTTPGPVTQPPPAPPRLPRTGGWTLAFERGDDRIVFGLPHPTVPWAKLDGASGIDLAPVQVFSEPLPDGDGDVVRGLRRGSRTLVLPVRAKDANYLLLRERVQQLLEMVGDLNPVDIVIAQPDGTRRRVTGYYASGAEGSYTKQVYGLTWRVFPLEFYVPDPWWRGPLRRESWKLTTAAAKPELSQTQPYFPVRLGSSTIVGQRVLTNTGHAEAYPTTLLTGPGSDAVLQNLTTGETFEIDGAITKPVTIITRPGEVDVYDDDTIDGDGLWDRTPVGSEPWVLARGDNLVRVTMTGATSDSEVAIEWEPRLRSAT